ncbi:MAG: hypothetical protein WC236_10820 [Gallionellaceae bacterium]|jgi:hypothetical protein
MKFNLYLIAFIYCFVSHAAISAEREFPSIDEFIATLPVNHDKQVIEGDLNNDQLLDKVVFEAKRVIQPSSPMYEELKIHILLKKGNGNFYIAQTSKMAPVTLLDKFFRGGEIRNGSLFIEFEGGLHPSFVRYQFKHYKGQWRLIGMTDSASDPYRTLPDGGVASNGADINLLTGDIEYISDEKQSARKRIGIKPCYLADFDFSEEFVDKHCKK